MASESSVFGLGILGVVVGLAVLLWGAEHGDNTFVTGGGIVVLAGVGLMTAYIAGLEGPTEEH